MKSLLYWALLGMFVVACGPSIEDQIEQLASGGQERDTAIQELLLRPDRAVGPLLRALDDPALAKGHPDIAEALVSLMLRVDDEALVAALRRHLVSHPDAQVRVRLAYRLGMLKRGEFAAELVQAAGDGDAEVSAEAFRALNILNNKLSEEDREQLDRTALGLIESPHEGVRAEASIRIERRVGKILDRAREAVTKAQIEAADSLYWAALAYAPNNWRARIAQARFFMENGQEQRGFDIMREVGAVFTVPRLAEAPAVDGQLDDAAWAAIEGRTMAFVGYRGFQGEAEMECRVRIGYTDEALYIGVYSYDAAPDSMLAEKTAHDDQVWLEDSIEIFLDANWDRRSYVQYIASSRPTVYDGVHENGLSSAQGDWNGDAQFASFVGEDFWSLECRLGYDERWVPKPVSGERWGGNFCRNFRDRSQSTQWVYTQGNFHQADQFGALVFE